MTSDEKKALQDVPKNIRRVLDGEVISSRCGLIGVGQTHEGGVWLSREAALAVLKTLKR